MAKIDSDLGKPLKDKSYGGNCLIYDVNRPESPWHNVWDKMDGFVIVHFIGWWLKVRWRTSAHTVTHAVADLGGQTPPIGPAAAILYCSVTVF